MVKDLDLLSVQEARTLVGRARQAWDSYAHFPQGEVDRIVAAAAEAASKASMDLARMAVEETGFGEPGVEVRVVLGGREKLHGALVSRVAFEQRVRRFENLFLLFVWSEIHLLLPVRYARGSPSMRVAT